MVSKLAKPKHIRLTREMDAKITAMASQAGEKKINMIRNLLGEIITLHEWHSK